MPMTLGVRDEGSLTFSSHRGMSHGQGLGRAHISLSKPASQSAQFYNSGFISKLILHIVRYELKVRRSQPTSFIGSASIEYRRRPFRIGPFSLDQILQCLTRKKNFCRLFMFYKLRLEINALQKINKFDSNNDASNRMLNFLEFS